MTDLTDKQMLQATFDEVGTIREELTGIKEQILEIQSESEKSRDEVNEKLDKILEVVSEKFATHHKRISKIEEHLGFATLN